MKIKACLQLFFLCIIKALNAATPVASIILSEPAVSNDLTHYTVTDKTNEPYTIQTARNGVQYRQILKKKYAHFSNTDTNSLITVTASITNASFRNAHNNKYDFRISGNLIFISQVVSAQNQADSLNFLIIMTDQQAWDTLGYSDNKMIKAPNLDRLASEGVNFSQAVTPCPVRCPAHILIRK